MYDLNVIKSIGCADVARKYGGIDLTRKGERLWGKLRSGDDTPSFCISINKNLWVDYGNANKGGSVIDLVMWLLGISKKDAINKLATDFNIPHIDNVNNKGRKWFALTDSQYRELGIQPERATLNFNIDLRKHSIDIVERWDSKYGMHVRDLAYKYPSVYNEMVSNIALNSINTLRETYYTNIGLLQDSSLNQITRDYLISALRDNANKINYKVELLQKALTNGNKSSNSFKVDVDKHIELINKNISLENQKIKNKMVNSYKRIFNCYIVSQFSYEQIKALKDLNLSITKDPNKFLSLDSIRSTYKLLGDSLEKLENEISKTHDSTKRIKIENDLFKIKDLFTKAGLVIEGIREANLEKRSEISKQNMNNKTLENNVELSQ